MTLLELRNKLLYNRFLTEAEAGCEVTFCLSLSLMRGLGVLFLIRFGWREIM